MPDAEDLKTLVSWLETESPSLDAAAVNAMGDRVIELAGAFGGVAATRLPGRDGLGDMLVLRAGPENSQPAALVIGHLDTVHPLGVRDLGLPIRRDGDRLYGPGVYDMKGGALLGVQAFLAAAGSGCALRPLIFAFSPDEEIGSPTSRPVIEALARTSGFALVLEPARAGGACVTARKAVGRVRISIEGRASHAGMRHEDGRSAIREAAHQILAIESITDYSAGLTASVGTVAGGTGVNVVPQFAALEVDFRAPTEALACDCARRLHALRPVDGDCRLAVQGGVNRPAYERTAKNTALFETARGFAAEVGLDLTEAPMTGGGSDGNFTAALGVATLDGLGIEGAGAHTLTEYGLLSSIAPRRALIQRLLET